MIYDFLGKKMTSKEVHNELLYNPKIKKTNIDNVFVLLAAQQKLDAERRIANETDPQRKAIMEEVYSRRRYNFDFLFGEE